MAINRAGILLSVWLASLFIIVWLLRGTPINQDLTQFMPSGVTAQQHLAVQLLREGPASRVILIGLRGAAPSELARISRDLAKLLQHSDLFTQANNGSFELGDDMGTVVRYRYLLDPTSRAEQFEADALQRALKIRLNELRSPLAFLDKSSLTSDPTAAARAIMLAWRPSHQPTSQEGVWFSADGEQALLLAVTQASGFDPQAQQTVIARLQESFAATQPAAGVVMEMTGSPVFADSARTTIRSDMQMLSGLGSLFIVMFLWLNYRSLRLVLLGALPLASALLVGSAATAWIFGSLHGITLVFGLTLLGVAFDYPVHLFSHLTSAGTAARAIRQLWPTLRLGVITTCLGYLAFARRDFTGLAQLGVFTTGGLIAAALTTRWLLPPLISTTPTVTAWHSGIARWLDLPQRLARGVILVAALVTALIFALAPPNWETELSALSPISSAARNLDAQLRRELGAADVSKLIIVSAPELDSVLEHSEQVALQLQSAVAQGLLSGYDYAARYLPSTTTQRKRQLSLPDTATLQQSLTTALQGLPFKPHSFDPFLRDIAASRTLPLLDFDAVQHTPIQARIAPLLYKNPDGWTAIISLTDIADANAFRTWWEAQPHQAEQLLDLKQVSTSILNDFRDSSLERLMLGVGAIWLSLALGLRSVRKAFSILLPILLATALCIALLGIFGERLSLFHLIALLLSAGIGIDYSLFFQRHRLSAGDHRSNLQALVVCAVSTLVVFGILAWSPIPVLRSIGLTVALGVPLCFLLALAAARWNARHT